MPIPFVGPPEPPAIVRHLEQGRRAPLHKGLVAGPVLASLYDAIATDLALNRGGSEANPIMAPFAHNDPLLYASKVGSGILTGLAANALAKRGHRTLGKVVSGIGIGVPLAAGSHNLAQIHALEGARE